MLLKNFAAYLRERFPPVNMTLFAILFFTVYSISSLAPEVAPPEVAPPDAGALVGVLAVISFFFRLRVFDEIKDYEVDALNHPQRVLQSGRITLRQLKIAALLGTTIELGWSVAMGTDVLIAWLVAVGYSLLMRYEFFVGGWLRKRLLVYAISHMLVMPLIIAWVWRAFSDELNVHFVLLATLSLLAGFSFEIARKIHAPSAERPTVDSYSQSVGYRFSIVLVLLLLLAGAVVQWQLLQVVAARDWAFVLLSLSYAVTLVIYLWNLTNAREDTLRKAELGVSLFMLISYVSIIIEANFNL